AVSNHQIVQTLESHPKLREYVGVGELLAGATGMIKSAAGASSYLVAQANRRADLTPWFDGVNDGAGLVKSDPRLLFRRVMFNMARRHAGQALRRRDTREHVGLYLTAFNAWADAHSAHYGVLVLLLAEASAPTPPLTPTHC